MKEINFDYLKEKIKPRPYNAHKGSMGCLFSVCGCYGMAGAQILSATGALRSGIGLLKLAIVDSVYPIVAPAVPEAVYLPMQANSEGRFSAENIAAITENANSANGVLVGCGLGVCDDTEKIVTALLTENQSPIVIDADGINCVAKHINLLNEKSCPTVLTPHPGEMSRLLGLSVREVEANRQKAAENFSREFSVVTVLKGADTIITDGEQTYISYAGNPGMSTGGSGDVLAGITASFLAQGYSPIESACIGAFVHGKAGDYARDNLTEISMLPRDIPNCLPKVFEKIF
ncbi:MAG: NAD(P)H-hydrate dehydratase [Ruminococcus sp.]|nr:NAD(P)H-hydrate dehydratase [Ruminococcus sp.]